MTKNDTPKTPEAHRIIIDVIEFLVKKIVNGPQEDRLENYRTLEVRFHPREHIIETPS